MTEILYDPSDDTLLRLTGLAETTVEGCRAASVTLLRRDGAETVAASDPVAQGIDEAQYAAGAGPCLAASRESRMYEVPDTGNEPRWPEFAAAALERGVLSSLSTPVRVGPRSIGALNLYSTEPDAFARAADSAQTLAAHVAATLTNARLHVAARTLADQLADARRSRPVIERAKGILMAQRGCTAEEAFALLRAASQRDNVKLREVAERLVAASTGHHPPR